MTEENISTQEAIVLATIDCINENGIEHLTTRMIAEKAGANIASINYYFRTKENLVNQALEITIKHMLEDVNETINNEDMDFQGYSKRRNLLHDLRCQHQYRELPLPTCTGWSLTRIMIRLAQKVSYQLLTTYWKEQSQKFPNQEQDQLRRILASIFSSIMFMMLTPFFFQLKEEKQLSEESFHQEMAEHYSEMFYAMI